MAWRVTLTHPTSAHARLSVFLSFLLSRSFLLFLFLSLSLARALSLSLSRTATASTPCRFADVGAIIKGMREDRGGSVQTGVQAMFIHAALDAYARTLRSVDLSGLIKADGVLRQGSLRVDWGHLQKGSSAQKENEVAEEFAAHLKHTPIVVVLIGALWDQAKGAAGWAGFVEEAKAVTVRQSTSALPTTFPASLAFLAESQARVMAVRSFKSAGMQWRPTWAVGLASALGTTDAAPIGELGSSTFSVCDATTGAVLKGTPIDSSNVKETATKINALIAGHPGLRIFATGTWRDTGVDELSRSVDADVAILKAHDEGLLSGQCAAQFANKLHTLPPRAVVTVVDGGAAGEPTHITTVRLNDAWLQTSAQSLEGRRHHASASANSAGGSHGHGHSRLLSPTGDRYVTATGGDSSSDGSVDVDNIGGRRSYGGPGNPKKLLQWPAVNATSL